jgi:hypothetical protein
MRPVESIMQAAFTFVDISTPVELLSTMITRENPAVLIRDFKTDKTYHHAVGRHPRIDVTRAPRAVLHPVRSQAPASSRGSCVWLAG